MLSNRRRRLSLESLERRTMLAADLLNGTLTVVGTTGNDNIQVQVATTGPHSGELQVDLNGQQSFFAVAQVSAIRILGLNGNDQITIDDNVSIAATILGGKGNDTIKGGSGGDTIHGDAGNDTIDGSDGDDLLFGDNGNDNINGEAGDDTCHGNNGKDDLHGGDDSDHLFGDNGMDRLWGDDDVDFLDGGNGKDDCRGGLGDDQLKGGRGRDRLDGEDGDDLLDTDKGKDDCFDGMIADLDREFRAVLFRTNSVVGEAEYQTEVENNSVQTTFKVEVEDLSPSSTFDVRINNVVVGQLTTDASGDGELIFSSAPTGNELPFPANFPTLHPGSTIAVDTALGVFTKSHWK